MGNINGAQLETAKWALHTNVAGLTHEQSLVTPEAGGNNLNWVVGHLITAYNGLLPAIGGEPVWSDEQAEPYKRGSEPLAPEKAMPFDRVLADFDTAHDRVVAGIAVLDDEALATPAPYSPSNNPDETLGSLLQIVAFHQSYHVGQSGILRRVVGHEGAIQ